MIRSTTYRGIAVVEEHILSLMMATTASRAVWTDTPDRDHGKSPARAHFVVGLPSTVIRVLLGWLTAFGLVIATFSGWQSVSITAGHYLPLAILLLLGTGMIHLATLLLSKHLDSWDGDQIPPEDLLDKLGEIQR